VLTHLIEQARGLRNRSNPLVHGFPLLMNTARESGIAHNTKLC